jgi:uncharacterized membrane protein
MCIAQLRPGDNRLRMAVFHLPKERIETLVDGVFAIAMTILVLELKVPPDVGRHDFRELFHQLAEDLPTVGAYFFSFFMLGTFWLWFHRMSANIARTDGLVIALNLLFLSLVCAFPFAAAVLGRYPVNAASLAIYLPLIGAILTTQFATFWIAERRGLIDPAVPRADVLAMKRRNLRGILAFAMGSIPASLRLGIWGPVPCLVVAAACAVAMRGLRR